MISPVTGNGMSMALQAGELAARWIAGYSVGALTWEEAKAALAREARARFARRLTWGWRVHQLLFSKPGRAALRWVGQLDWAWQRIYAATR